MSYTTHNSKVRTIKQDDPKFQIVDGFAICPRAALEISQNIPYEYSLVLTECIDRGWIKPIAYMTERELLISGLSK